MEAVTPTLEERDLMRKLGTDIARACKRNYELCDGVCEQSRALSMQLNVLTIVMISSFVELYGNADKVPEFIEAVLRSFRVTERSMEL